MLKRKPIRKTLQIGPSNFLVKNDPFFNNDFNFFGFCGTWSRTKEKDGQFLADFTPAIGFVITRSAQSPVNITNRAPFIRLIGCSG